MLAAAVSRCDYACNALATPHMSDFVEVNHVAYSAKDARLTAQQINSWSASPTVCYTTVSSPSTGS